MSAFLGPIHHIMYQKIQLQNQLTEFIIEQLDSTLAPQVQNTCGSYTKGNLEDVIDHTQIHQWLSEEVIIAEKRLAFTLASLLSRGPEILVKIEEVCHQFAKTIASQYELDSCATTFQTLQKLLLDGMPCDGGIHLHHNTADEILWEVSPFVHDPYWKMYGLDMSYAMKLRYAWLQGFIQNSNLTVERLQENIFKLGED